MELDRRFAHSGTVQAEVYLKNLVSDVRRRGGGSSEGGSRIPRYEGWA